MAKPLELIEEYYTACVINDLGRVKKCIEKRVDINLGDHDVSPFRAACEMDHQAIVKYLIEQGADVATPGCYGGTGLSLASMNGHTRIVEMLLIQDSSTCFIRNRYANGDTALIAGASWGHEDVVRLLLNYDPSEGHIMIKNSNGKQQSM